MFCQNCGAQIEAHEKFCKVCGAPNSQQPKPVSYQPLPESEQEPVKPAPAQYPINGPRRTCFMVGIITAAMIILISLFTISGVYADPSGSGSSGIPVQFITGEDVAYFTKSILVYYIGLLAVTVLMAAAVVSIVFNSISNKNSTTTVPARCNKLRMVSAVMALLDSLDMIICVVFMNSARSHVSYLSIIAIAVTIALAIIYVILAIDTTCKSETQPVMPSLSSDEI